MNNLEGYLVELLQGHINCDDTPVQVVRQFSQHPERPVITLDTSPGVSTQHVYTDPSTNSTLYERHATVNINIWCDSEEQRADITLQVMQLFQLEQDYHYIFCCNYQGGEGKLCNATGEKCGAVDRRNTRCPSPYLYEYQGLRERWGIIQGTLNVEPPFDLDDLSDHPPLLRSIMRCECQYSVCLGNSTQVERVDADVDGVFFESFSSGTGVWSEYFGGLVKELEDKVRGLLGLDELRTIFSPLGHRHDELYSQLGHNHDLQYASLGHNHDDRYSQLGHTHVEYATRAEVASLASEGHEHKNVLYVSPFRVRDADLTYVLCEIEPVEVMILEDLTWSHFTVEDQRGKYIFLSFDETVDPERTYHLLYYTVHTDGVQQDTFLNVNDVLANVGDTVNLYSTVTDGNNAPVDEGTVDYSIDDGNGDGA